MRSFLNFDFVAILVSHCFMLSDDFGNIDAFTANWSGIFLSEGCIRIVLVLQ